MADDARDLEYTLRIRDQAAKALDSIEKKLVVIDKRMTDVGTTSAATNQTSQRAFDRTSATVTTADGKFRKLGASIGIASASLQSLGVEGSGAAGALVGRFASLAASAGPVAIGIATIATTVWGLKTAFDALDAGRQQKLETLRGYLTVSAKLATLMSSAKSIDLSSAAGSNGSTAEIESGRSAIDTLRQQEDDARRQRDAARVRVRSIERNPGSYGIGDLGRQQDVLNQAESTLSQLIDRRTAAEQAVTTLTAEEARKRSQITTTEIRDRLTTIRDFQRSSAEIIGKANAETASIVGRDYSAATPLESEVEGIRASEGARRRAELQRRLDQIDAQERARLDVLSAQGANQTLINSTRAGFALARNNAPTGVDVAINQETDALIAAATARNEVRLKELRGTLDAAARVSAGAVEAVGLDRYTAAAAEAKLGFDAAVKKMIDAGLPESEAKDQATADLKSRLDKISADRQKAIEDFTRLTLRATDATYGAAFKLEDAAMFGKEARKRLLDPNSTDIDRASAEAEIRRADAVAARNASLREADRAAQQQLEDMRRRNESTPEAEAAVEKARRAAQYQIGVDYAQATTSLETNLGVKITGIHTDTAASVANIERSAATRVLGIIGSQTEQEVAEIEQRYAREIEALRKKGATELDLLRLQGARKAELEAATRPSLSRSRAGVTEDERKALDNPSGTFGAGFSARIDAMTANLQSAAEIGATAAQRLGDGFSMAFSSIATGSASAGEAFKSFGLSVIETATQVAAQQAVISLLGAAFGAASASANYSGSGASATVSGLEMKNTNPYRMAEGGVLNSPTHVLAGEAGPEAFVPLDSGAIPVRLKGGAGGARISISQSFNVSGGMDEQAKRELRKSVREETLAAVRQALRNDTDMRSAVRRI